MFVVGEIARFNSKVPNSFLCGCYVIITHVLTSGGRYSYDVRFQYSSFADHSSGSVIEQWIDKV